MINIKITKLISDTVLPTYAHPGDAGMDVFSRENHLLQPGERHTFVLGFAAELPVGYVALVWDRGGLAHKQGIHCLGGVIDSNYRGEYVVVLYNTSKEPYQVRVGDKIAQILIQPVERAAIVESSDLSSSSRADSRYGSSGR
jgi:dUTP pyrophosphatase